MFDTLIAPAPGLESAVLPADGALQGLRRAGEELAEAVARCREWSGPQRTAFLRSLDQVAGVLATARSQLLVAEQQAGTSLAPGDRDFAAARARLMRSGYGYAAREVAQATTLDAMPQVAAAVRAGTVPLAHVDALARVTGAASESGSAALSSAEGQAAVIRLATRLTLKDFSARVAQLAASEDPCGLERDAERQRAARFLHLSHQPDGTFLRGRLDRVDGEILRAALASTGQAPDETRDKAQADADALVALAQRASAGSAGMSGIAGTAGSTGGIGGTAGTGGTRGTAGTGSAGVAGTAGTSGDVSRDAGNADGAADTAIDGAARAAVPAGSSRPHLSLLVPAATFVEVTEQARGSATPRGRLSRRTSSRVAPAMLEDGTPVAMSRLAQALCDCEISRVVLAAGSIPVDLGRTQRLYPAAHRRAVVVRDRHCAWNGCEVPATFSEVHHIRWWVRDRGSTSLENAVLLCSHHHHVVHALDLSITRVAAPRAVVPVPNDPRRPSAGGPRDAPALGCTDLGEPVRYTFRRPDGTVVSSAAGDGSGDGSG